MAVWNTPSLIPQVSPPTLTDELISLISARVKARTRSEPLTGSPGELLRALGEGPEAAHQLGDEVDGDPGVGHQEVAEGPVGEHQAAEQPALGAPGGWPTRKRGKVPWGGTRQRSRPPWARTVAVRGPPSRALTSPKKSPGP